MIHRQWAVGRFAVVTHPALVREMIHTRPGNEKLTFYTGRVPGQPLYNYLFLLRLKIGTEARSVPVQLADPLG